MVIELQSSENYRETISRNRLVVIAVCSRSSKNWDYIIKLFQYLEELVKPKIVFGIIDVNTALSDLEDYEISLAKKDVIIKMYLNGSCIFSQEGVFHSIYNDIETLKEGIRSTLKKHSIQIKFVRSR